MLQNLLLSFNNKPLYHALKEHDPREPPTTAEMSGWENGGGWASSGDARNALKEVTNTRTSPAEEGAWSKASHEGRDESKDYGGQDDYDGDARGKPFGGCFRCGSEDHMKSDCPEPPKPPKPVRECFNCSEVGHCKADCTNERVARPFVGTCNICQKEGHRPNECPTAPTKLCKNCEDPEVDGHTAATCKNRSKIQRPPVVEGQAEEAWHLLEAAAREGDMEDVKEAMKMYTDALPDVTYPDLEEAFRNMNIPVYLVAIEKSVINSFTIIDLQGNIDKQYAVWIRKSPKPSRPYEAEMWPATAEENFERLKDAGVVESRRAVRCSGCGELGHTRNYCQDAVPVVTRGSVIHCYNCGEDGHRYRDCQKTREDKNACRNCKQSGHESRECPEPRNLDNVNCDVCDQMGHFGRDCSTTGGSGGGDRGPRGCFNCDSVGHMSKECPLPRDYSRVKCKTCGEIGHTAVRCKSGDDDGDSRSSGGGLMDAGGSGWGTPFSYVEDVPVKASGWAEVPKGNVRVEEEFPVSGGGGWSASASVPETTPAKPVVSLYNSSSKGSSQADTPPSAGQASTAPHTGSAGYSTATNNSPYAAADSPWSVDTPPSAGQGSIASRTGSSGRPNSSIKISPQFAVDSPWKGMSAPASGNSFASRPSGRSEQSWDSWGICARDGEVDQCSGNRHTQKSTGSGRIFSDTKITPGEKLRPLFYDDGKNRHVKLASNLPIIPSPLGDVPVTADNRFSQFTYNYEDGDDRRVSQLSLNSDENEDDIPRAGGFGGGSSSPVTNSSAHPANTGPAGTRSSVPAYAYQPARGPNGSGARPFSMKPAAAAFISKTAPQPSVEEAPVAVAAAIPLPPTPQAAAKFMSPHIPAASATRQSSPVVKSTPSPLGPAPRARASTVGKPFLPPHMATPTRPVERATDLPYRDMEHLERTPPPKGAEVFFDHNVAEYAVVDESAPASPTTTQDGGNAAATGTTGG